MTGYWYLGSPYSQFAQGLEAAHAAVCREAARLIRARIAVFSPIAHTHPIAVHGEIDPFDHQIWLPADRAMMDAAHGLIVLMLNGWEQSYGLKYEIEVFSRAGKPIIHMDPGKVPDAVLLSRPD